MNKKQNPTKHKKIYKNHNPKIICERCGAQTSVSHKRRHQSTPKCQEDALKFGSMINQEQQKKQKKAPERISYALGANPPASQLHLIEKIERQLIRKEKPTPAAGMLSVKKDLFLSVILPILMKETADQGDHQEKALNSLLLFGPPGTGKTLIVQNLTAANTVTFFEIKSSTLMSKWMGESEKVIALIFKMATYYEPSVIFFDEADALFGTRTERGSEFKLSMTNDLLKEINEVNCGSKNVSVIGATNRPESLDSAFLRRMGRILFIGLPDEKDRALILKSKFQRANLAEEVDFELIAKQTANFSSADLEFYSRFVRQQTTQVYANEIAAQLESTGWAATSVMIENFKELKKRPLTAKDFEDALARFKPMADVQQANFLEEWGNKHSRN